MRARVSTVIRRHRAAELVRHAEIDAEPIRIGRGAGNEIHLADPRVLLLAATLHRDEDGLRLVAAPGQEVELNGALVPGARLRAGDRVLIAPFEIEVTEPEPGFDLGCRITSVAAIEEANRPTTDAATEVVGRVGRGRGVVSWLVLLAVLVPFGLLPGIAHHLAGSEEPAPMLGARPPPTPMQGLRALWSSGPMSGAHGFFGERCGVCHRAAFERVTDTACLACHRDLRRHADPALLADEGRADTATCRACHAEHRGQRQAVRDDDAFCIGCHGDIRAGAPTSTLVDVRGFAAEHPEFRLAGYRLTIEGAADTWADARGAPAVDRSDLSYAHRAHGGAKDGVPHPTKGRWKFTCGDCHDAEPSGPGFRPPRYDHHCAECHRIRLEEEQAATALPHANAELVRSLTVDLLTAAASRGAVPAAAEPESPLAAVLARLPEPTAPDRVALERAVAAPSFGEALCGLCHVVVPTDGGGWTTRPTRVAESWLAYGRFDHRRHGQIGCNDCHRATESPSARDVIIPGIDTCRHCHDAPGSARSVAMRCVDCHDFHHLGPSFTPAH